MAHPEQPANGDQHRQALRVVGFALGVVLLVPAGLLSYIIGALMSMGNDSCLTTAEHPTCAPANHELLVLLPLGGFVAGLLAGVLGGGLALRRRRSPLGWLVMAWGALLLADLVAMSLGTQT
jgi:hypothetical protein